MTVASYPQDSVLRRHAETERMRIQGLPPTDSILRRHYQQLQDMNSASPAPAASPAASNVTPFTARPAAPAREAHADHGGGLLGWLRRLLSA